MDVKERIINEAGKLLWSHGPSLMTMDTVARNCGMSKRTLYEHFPDKQTLVKECLAHEQRKHDKEFKEIFSNAENCFDALFKTFLKVRDDMQRKLLSQFEEIKRMYPDLHEGHEQEEKRFVKGLSDTLRKAQDEGYVMKSLNTDIAAFLFFNTMRNLHMTERLELYDLNKMEVFDAAFLNFLRGISTIEGIAFIDSHVQEIAMR